MTRSLFCTKFRGQACDAGAKTQTDQDVYERQIRAVAVREFIDELAYELPQGG